MPECQHCGGHVTGRYARVFSLHEYDRPRVCLACGNTPQVDAVRRHGGGG